MGGAPNHWLNGMILQVHSLKLTLTWHLKSMALKMIFPSKWHLFQVRAVSFKEGKKQKELKQLSETPETYYQ